MDRKFFFSLMVFSFALATLYLVYTILSPFFPALAWACFIGIAANPLYTRLTRRLNDRRTLSAAVMTLVVILTLVLPVVGLSFLVVDEVSSAYAFFQQIAGGKSDFVGNLLNHPYLSPFVQRVRPGLAQYGIDLRETLLPAVNRGMGFLLGYTTGFLKNIFGFVVELFLMVITLFFIYRDGRTIASRVWSILPLRPEDRLTLTATVKRVLNAVIYGVFFTCIVQGTLGGIGFWFCGIPSPVLFGGVMSVCSLVPVFGTALIWVPGAVFLFLTGETMMALLLLGWGTFVISSVDNFIRPVFISGKGNIHILITALGGLGGLVAFGLLGIIAGPLLLALFVDLLDIYGKLIFGSADSQG